MKTNFLKLLVITALFYSCSKSSSDVFTPIGNWTETSTFISYPRSGSVAFTIGNNSYVGLGYNICSLDYYLDFYKYNPTNNTWSQVSAFPGEGRTNAVAFVIGDTAYVGSGFHYNKLTGETYSFNDFYKYIPNDGYGEWKKIASIPGFPRFSAVAFSIGGNGYVGTGTVYNGSYLRDTTDFYQYNPSINAWSTNDNIKFAGQNRSDAVSFVINNKAYLATGYNKNSKNYTSDVYEFDPTLSGNKWRQKKSLDNVVCNNSSIERSKAVGLASTSKGYVMLGQNGNSSYTNSTWEYDPLADTWTLKTSFEGTGRINGVGFFVNGHLFITTGACGYTLLDDTWEFKPDEKYDENN